MHRIAIHFPKNYCNVWYAPQLHQLPLTSWQNKKVPQVSEFLGPHPFHWGIQKDTEFTTMEAAVEV